MSDLFADVAPEPTPILHSGRLTPISIFGDLQPLIGGAFLLIAIALGILYGLMWLQRGPSVARTFFKTVPVTLLALAAILLGGPLGLFSALAFSAAGDALLSVDGRRRLGAGLAAFLIAHLAYIGVFLVSEFPRDAPGLISPLAAVLFFVIVDPWRGVGIVAALAVAIGLGRWLWRDLGGLRWPVAAYIAAIVGMVATAFLLLPNHLIALPGAILFMASDAILSVQLFKPNTAWAQGLWAKRAVWYFYFTGQLLITLAFLP